MKLLLATSLVASVSGHASLIMPNPRNSIDNEEEAWANGAHPSTGWIEPYDCLCTNGTEICNNAQACFWFSQGCSIGCNECDMNGQRWPNYDHCPGQSVPVEDKILKMYWTANTNVAENSIEDIHKFNPWRAPGKAPVSDVCGMAGGVDHEVFNAGAYNTTRFAKQGDLGSVVLPKRPTGVQWKRGEVVDTRWAMTAKHGGGYQYRLCKADQELTEECMQATPMKFATKDGEHYITFRFNDTTLDRDSPLTVVTEGTGGLGWAVNPLPNPTSFGCDYVVDEGEHCDWECPGCGAPTYAADDACPCKCYDQYHELSEHSYGTDPDVFVDPVPDHEYHEFAIEDHLIVPDDIEAGEYVLGWRWDCEMSSQVWSNCADLEIL